MARHFALWTLAAAVALTGCTPNPGPDDHNTGGGAISQYEGHSARTPGTTGTGSSSAARGQGPVAGTGAPEESGNAQSASESNGGTGGMTPASTKP